MKKLTLKDAFKSVFVNGDSNPLALAKVFLIVGLPILATTLVYCILNHLSK